MKALVVVDMQNDFVTGSLGSPQAQAAVEVAKTIIQGFDGPVIVTLDTHGEDYLSTREGSLLPVLHCVKDTWGWQLDPQIQQALAGKEVTYLEKPTFASDQLVPLLGQIADLESVSFLGICTDICVLSNVMVTKMKYYELPIYVYPKACAGVSPQKHQAALDCMQSCQIEFLEA